jgi:hypothetical protein
MGRFVAVLAAALLGGCAATLPGDPVAILTDSGYSSDTMSCWLPINMDSEVLVADPKTGTALEGANGEHLAAKWPPGYTGRRVGSEVNVYDAHGMLVATTGQRYRFDWVAYPDGAPARPFGTVICRVNPA